jgi:hypothetical protein
MTSHEVVVPAFGAGKEPTYDKKYIVYNGSLAHARTKNKIEILKTEGSGKHNKLVLTKYYEKSLEIIGMLM